MVYENLTYSFLSIIIVFITYKIHRYWLNLVNENKKAYYMPMIYIRTIGHWIFIIGLLITSLVFLFKSFQ
jgi:hypothetical protein